MLYIKPDYYDRFSCTADRCEDTCCAGWQIVIDPESIQRYKEEKGPFRKQLHKNINWRKKVFRQDKIKRCAFLNDENLCDLYSALGERALCQTCDRYPRHIEEFENVRELSLSVSCPEVAKYLLARQEPVEFLYEETEETEQCPDFEEMDFDVLLYDILSEGRNAMLTCLQNRQDSMKIRCEKILHLAKEMEELISEGQAFFVFDLLDTFEKGQMHFQKRKLRRTMDYSKRVIHMIFRLELLRDDWESMLSESASLLYLEGGDHYDEISSDFIRWQEETEFSLEIPLEQMAVYFVTTYFCGAVYDGNILAKVQSSVLCLYVISELCKARWLKNQRTLDKDDLYDIVYRFSRELEHSDRNLSLIEKMAAAALPMTDHK